MANDPTWETVGDYVTLVRGTTYDGRLVGKPGPALLGLGSIEPGGGFRINHYRTYGGECPAELMLSPGDLYASLKGATKDGKMIGSVAKVPSSVPSGRLTQDTVKLVFRKPSPEDAAYLHWILRTPQYRDYCAGHAMGSAVVALSRRDFLSYLVPPPTATRKRIVALLDVIEEKIELNRRFSETLESTARALFKSWFIDFEPVRAGAEGREPALPKRLADVFPARFIDSELGPIPEGWRVRSLDEIARFLNGLALQKYPQSRDRYLPVIKIAQLRSGRADGMDRASVDLEPDYVVADGDILFSWSGSLECVLWAGGPGALNQHIFKVTSADYPRWLCYFAIHHHLEDFRHIAAGKATTMGHIQRRHLTEAKLAIPEKPIPSAIDDHISSLFESFWKRNVESRTTIELRDALLAKLISGEVRVNDAEELVGSTG